MTGIEILLLRWALRRNILSFFSTEFHLFFKKIIR